MLSPFPKWSVLHSFAYFVIDGLIDETIDNANSRKKLWVEHAFQHHGIVIQSFSEWLRQSNTSLEDVDAVYEYHSELRLSGSLEELITHFTNEVFFLLFANLQLLTNLNEYVASIVSGIELDDLAEASNPHGV